MFKNTKPMVLGTPFTSSPGVMRSSISDGFFAQSCAETPSANRTSSTWATKILPAGSFLFARIARTDDNCSNRLCCQNPEHFERNDSINNVGSQARVDFGGANQPKGDFSPIKLSPRRDEGGELGNHTSVQAVREEEFLRCNPLEPESRSVRDN